MIVIISDVRSIHNVGSIFRTADAAGISKIYLAGITPEPTDRFGKVRPQFSKVALGAEKSMQWEKVKSATHTIDALKKEGFKIFAVEQAKNSVVYTAVKNKKLNLAKVVLVMGNEVAGLSRSALKRADAILEIPMRGKKESLNVSVAFGIVLFHLLYG
jgi:tRNA G18 (ribose-2'-O)-methylase SpoU